MGTIRINLISGSNFISSVPTQKCVTLTLMLGAKKRKTLLQGGLDESCLMERNRSLNQNLTRIDRVLTSQEWGRECFSDKLRK